MNKYKILALTLLSSMALLFSACGNGDEAGLAEACMQDCEDLGYEYHKLIKISPLSSRCQCWNEGMDTRHNPWGKQ